MEVEKIKVLYVDDEEMNLVAFRANFRKEYDVYTAIGATEALIILEQHAPHIIIADQRMPHTTGVDFLEQTLNLYPDCIRLLITAQSDIDLVIQAINRGQVSKFIQKPWDWEKLSIALDNCATLYKSRIELKLKNDELQKINEELNKFVYRVSHDLRAPLTSMMGVINLTKLMPELNIASSYFDMIEGRALKLDTFIKKIIDYHKNAKIDTAHELINFKTIITAIWDNLKNQDALIQFTLKVEQSSEFIADFFRLEIILENLISNAIKYQNPSTQLRTIGIAVDSDDSSALITISDNGVGIDRTHFESIFNLFFRTESTAKTEGTGIGLYIVKEAVEKMGGKISVASELMKGTMFEIIIPNSKLM